MKPVSVALLLVASVAFAQAAPGLRVVNGETATLGQFPYQVRLTLHVGDGQRALCGGSLLNEEWVLTAGHCVMLAKSVEVHLGAVDFDGGLVLESTEFFKHEKYNPLFVANDVALVKLPQKVEFNENVQPVRLPTGNDDFAGESVVVSGWGLTENGGPVSQQLQYATLQVITNSECQKTFSPLVVRKSTLCARGDEKESPCNGDSGGPLVLAEDKTLVGVVSFGHALGCERGFPAAFARVTAFRDWVKKHTGV
ncbi:collagenase-like [Anopheles maculipalpis]|uniref:collagenase-like n=1 Tax=Anopheles maculipalpis TaxID=1496333 RepID=UPI002159AC7F|nr:collagenase-like [Anopheles maculipalpis]